MGDKIRKSVQKLSLGIDDEPVVLPPEIVSRAASINRFTLVVTTVNPKKQNLRALIGQMPRVWGLADSCVGRILSPGKVQFKFRNEESMNLVLHRGPWSFNDWMLTVHRWYPNITEEEMKIIPFWVRIHGIPTLYLTNAMARFVGNRLGPVTEVDFDENVNNVGFVRVQMNWNVDSPLRFQRNYQFDEGENTLISFHFERLRNFCSKCGSLKHDVKECSLTFDDEDDDNSSGDDNEDDPNGAEEEMSEDNDVSLNDTEPTIPGLQSVSGPSKTMSPPSASGPSQRMDSPETSVSSSPSVFEDTDLTAERLRYLHAKYVRESLIPPGFCAEDLTADVSSTSQAMKRSRDEFEVLYQKAEAAEEMAVLSHFRNHEKRIKSENVSSTFSGGAGGPVPPWEPI